jgi:hypothetical protein
MRKFYSIPLIFFVLAASLGLFLRWQFISPTPGVNFRWFLHSHSHVMFLGWAFNIIYLSFVQHHIPASRQQAFYKLFIGLQVLVTAMMISFPIQGYGTWSIIFSTLHTFGALAFIILFFRRTRGPGTVSLWFARMGLIFFAISTAGPFSLGYLMANGFGQTVWYNLSIYYYLHFQYNGFFLFGVIAMFLQLLEIKEIRFNVKGMMSFGKWLAVACIPAYALSVLFAKPPAVVYIIGAAAAAMQLFALYMLIGVLKPLASQLAMRFQRVSYTMLWLILSAFCLKLVLQLASAHPDIADLAYELRPVVIAYLHLVLVGIISLFLIVWYLEKNLATLNTTRLALAVLLTGFVGSEICLILVPWWSAISAGGISFSGMVFAFSVPMFAGAVLLYIAFLRKSLSAARPSRSNPDKNQFPM